MAEKLVDILEFVADKDEFTTEQIVSHFGFNATTAKRYLRQLTEFGYLESHHMAAIRTEPISFKFSTLNFKKSLISHIIAGIAFVLRGLSM